MSSRETVLAYIDTTFDQILSEIKKRPHGNPHVTLCRIQSCSSLFDRQTHEPSWKIHSRVMTYGWPGRNENEAWRFTCVIRVLFQIRRAILSKSVVTKRDIYYHDPQLFRTQTVVDRFIEDIAHTCRVTRGELNVAASPKGLYVGLPDNEDIVNSISENGLPGALHCVSHLKWILIVEKEATFKHLIEHHFHRSQRAGPGIMVTGRGYPDLATHLFLQGLMKQSDNSVPLHGLFDADPDGLNIYLCYWIGSKVMAQQAEQGIPQMQWIGIGLDDVNGDDRIRLTARDRSKAQHMLAKRVWQAYSLPSQKYRAMLQTMLMLNVKAEIQTLENGCGGLVDLLESRLTVAEPRGEYLR